MSWITYRTHCRCKLYNRETPWGVICSRLQAKLILKIWEYEIMDCRSRLNDWKQHWEQQWTVFCSSKQANTMRCVTVKQGPPRDTHGGLMNRGRVTFCCHDCLLLQPSLVTFHAVRPQGVMVRITFTAYGRQVLKRDGVLTVNRDAGRFYGTLRLGITHDNDNGLPMMTVERLWSAVFLLGLMEAPCCDQCRVRC